MSRLTLLLTVAVALGACADDAPAPEPTVPPPIDTVGVVDVPTPFDSAAVLIGPIEPPEQPVAIPPRPAPPRPIPPPRPDPTPTVVPRPQPRPVPPITRTSSGSCDVRGEEGYCFAFTGDGWTPEAARTRCAAAPDASFDAGTCPLTNRIATCTYTPPSTPGREIVYTYYAPYDIVLAELACPGTFERVE